jgi:alkylated DNA nucleotide flippase Atl1
MSTSTATMSPAAIAAFVAETIDPVFATIDGWRDAVEAELSRHPEPTAAALDPFVSDLVRSALSGPGLITGAGFVATPGFLVDAPFHLAWWLAGNGSRDPEGVRRLAAVSDPESEDFRDYTGLEWWRVPQRTGTRHLTGPYVDYVCTDDYTVTITTPVRVGGQMAGIVGTDVYAWRLEQDLRRVIRGAGAPCVVVNASGRVVTATESRREPGSILRLEGLAETLAPLREANPGEVTAMLPGGQHVLACGDTSLALVIGT